MDKKLLASEIEKEIKAAKTVIAAEKKKWEDLDDRERFDIIRDLKKKHNVDKDYDPLKRRGITLSFNQGFKNQVEANVNWPCRGSHSIEDAEKFARGLLDGVLALKKAAEELKKQYPEVKIVEVSDF